MSFRGWANSLAGLEKPFVWVLARRVGCARWVSFVCWMQCFRRWASGFELFLLCCFMFSSMFGFQMVVCYIVQ